MWRNLLENSSLYDNKLEGAEPFYVSVKLVRGHSRSRDLWAARRPTILLTDLQFPVRENANLIHTAKTQFAHE